MEEKVDPRKIRDFGEIINDTFLFAKQNWRPMLRAFVPICGFFIIAGCVTQIFYQMNLIESIGAGGDPNSLSGLQKMFGWEYFFNLAFSLLSYLVVPLFTFSFIALYKVNGNVAPDIADVWDYIKYYFLRFLGTSIVLGALLFVGFVMCFIPGIYLWPAVSLVFAIMVIENGSLSYAFPRAFELIKDNWWPTFGVLFILSVVVLAASFIILIPLFAIGLADFFMPLKQSTLGIVLTAVLSNLTSVFRVLPAIGLAMCYYSLVEQKEGTGLSERIENFGRSNDAPDQEKPEEY